MSVVNSKLLAFVHVAECLRGCACWFVHPADAEEMAGTRGILDQVFQNCTRDQTPDKVYELEYVEILDKVMQILVPNMPATSRSSLIRDEWRTETHTEIRSGDLVLFGRLKGKVVDTKHLGGAHVCVV